MSVHEVAVCLLLVKVGREINGKYPPDYQDNRDDIAGYANVMQMVHDWEGERDFADDSD